MILKASMEKRLFVGRPDGRSASSVLKSMPSMRATIDRRRQEVDDGVEQRLNALVLEGRAAENRMERATLHGGTDQPAQGRIVRLLAVQVGHHGLVVHLDGSFDQLAAILGSLVLQLGRDLVFVEGQRRAPRRTRRSPSS